MERDAMTVDLKDAPVSIELDALGNHDSVLTALARRYEIQGHTTQQLWVGDLPDGTSHVFDLAVPDARLLLEVETVDTLISLDAQRYAPWRAAGYEVWVVVPEERMEQVKRRMKASVDHLQGWTMHGSQVKFEQPLDA